MLRRMMLATLLIAISGCSAQQAAESADDDLPSSSGASEPGMASPDTADATADATATASPSPSAAPLAACDLVADASSAPAGTTAGEPRLETLDDLRARVEAAAAGSPARAAAEANLEAFEGMGLVERCAITFGSGGAAGFSSSALIFEDAGGAAAYLEFLKEGCEGGQLPASATIEAVVIACPALLPPIVYVATTDGAVVQTASASASAAGTVDQAAIDQALRLLEEVSA